MNKDWDVYITGEFSAGNPEPKYGLLFLHLSKTAAVLGDLNKNYPKDSRGAKINAGVNLVAMNLFRYFFSLSYFLCLDFASTSSSDEFGLPTAEEMVMLEQLLHQGANQQAFDAYSLEQQGGEMEVNELGTSLTLDEHAQLGKLVIEGDDPQDIADLLVNREIEYCEEIKACFESMIQLGRTRSFEYLFPNVFEKDQDDVVSLIDLALQEHQPEICRILCAYNPESHMALLNGDYHGQLTDFWETSPFLWTDAELEDLLFDFPDLAECIFQSTDMLLLHVREIEPILMAIRLTRRFVENEYDGQGYAPEEILEAVLDRASRFRDEDFARILRCIIERDANVTEEMRDRFLETHPEHTHSKLVLGDAVAAVNDVTHLKQPIAGGDVPEAIAMYVRGHPFRFARYTLDVLKAAIMAGRIGSFEYLLPFVRDFPEGPNCDRQMTHLFVRAVYDHQPEMCHMLLNHGFYFDSYHVEYALSNFWRRRPFPWAEAELMEVISRAPQFAHRFCIRPRRNQWFGFESANVVSMLIKVNHRYGSGYGKDYQDPTAMLHAVLDLNFADEEVAGLIEQLSELGAEVTEEMKEEYVRNRSYLRNPEHAAGLKAIEDILTIPDVKGVEE